MWSKCVHKLFRSYPIGEQVDQIFYIEHPVTTGLGLTCAAATTKGCIVSLNRGIKVIKGMVVPKHWTLLLTLCAIELNCFILSHQHWDLGLWMPSVQSQRSSRWNCNTMHAQSPTVYACTVRALECVWLECSNQGKPFDGPVTGVGHALKASLSEFSGQQTFGLVAVVLGWVSHNTVKDQFRNWWLQSEAVLKG